MSKETSLCIGEPAAQFAERYVQGTLPEFESARFEEHYFDCEVCLGHVQTLQSMAERLGRDRQPEKVMHPRRKGSLVAWPGWAMAAAAIAAMLLIVFAGYRMFSRQAVQSPIATSAPVRPVAPTPPVQAGLPELADVSLPPFNAGTLRGGREDAHFADGMRAYRRGDCGTALPELAQVGGDSALAASAQFYSGICQMHSGNLTGGAQTLRSIAKAGDSPQQEAALYYLAQVALADNDAATGRRYLQNTIKLRGEFEQRARAELKQVDKITKAK